MSFLCFTEAQYAINNCKKNIIPLRYEKDFKATGWLGLLIGSILYYEVHSDETMMANLPKIKQALNKRGAIRHPLPGKSTLFCKALQKFCSCAQYRWLYQYLKVRPIIRTYPIFGNSKSKAL